jgi:molybdenum-dependent DNA-binding transcriptional regulator ModE
MRLGAHFWREKDGTVVVSAWRVALREAVEQTGSMNAAAAQQGVPCRVAWQKFQSRIMC